MLEGVVLLAGQNAMLDTLDRLSVRLPGVRRGVELVLRDERWHIGFGTSLVQGAGLGQDEVEALLALGQAAAGAWGDLVSPDAAERAVRMHRNRLRGVHIKFFDPRAPLIPRSHDAGAVPGGCCRMTRGQDSCPRDAEVSPRPGPRCGQV